MSGPSQPKVEGEQWSDERIAGFLNLKPLDDCNEDFHVLQQAYQHMTPDFFSRFLAMFIDAGRDLNALSLEGETITGRVAQHSKSGEYLELLQKNGGSPAAS